MDPRFLKTWAAPEPLFSWLSYDKQVMTEARRVLNPPTEADQPFAISLRIMTVDGTLEVSTTPEMWWWQGRDAHRDTIAFPRQARWVEEARKLSQLGLALAQNERIAAEIYKFLPKPAVGDLSFFGHFFLTAQGAVILRDLSVHTVAQDGGRSAIFPLLPTPPGKHLRIAQMTAVEAAIRNLHKFEDSGRAASPEHQYKISTFTTV